MAVTLGAILLQSQESFLVDPLQTDSFLFSFSLLCYTKLSGDANLTFTKGKTSVIRRL